MSSCLAPQRYSLSELLTTLVSSIMLEVAKSSHGAKCNFPKGFLSCVFSCSRPMALRYCTLCRDDDTALIRFDDSASLQLCFSVVWAWDPSEPVCCCRALHLAIFVFKAFEMDRFKSPCFNKRSGDMHFYKCISLYIYLLCILAKQSTII